MKTSQKVIATLTATASLFTAVTATSTAQSKEGIGVGLIAGEPTGISFKNWIDQTHAIDGAIAVSIVDDNAFQAHADYLVHDFSTLNTPEQKGSTPWYYGAGARLMRRNDDTHFGVRAPLGLDYLFADSQLDFFAEVAPVIDITPKIGLDMSAAIGLRYYFR